MEMSWLEEHIRELLIPKDEVKKLVEVGNNIAYEVGSWAPLKLAYLKFAATFYTDILAKQRYNGRPFNVYYIDLLSASGVNKVRKTSDYFLGSPLIITKKTDKEHPFTKLFFCDTNNANIEALRARLGLDLDKERYEIFPLDCNEALDKILPQLREPYHCLIFVDQEAMELHWRSMERLLRLHADIILNYQSAGVVRGKEGHDFKLFFRDHKRALEIDKNTEMGKKRDALLAYYMEELQTSPARRDTIVRSTKVRSEKSGFWYNLLYITRKTSGGSKWLRALTKINSEVEGNSDKAVDLALDVLVHGQTKLSSPIGQRKLFKQA